MLSIGGLAKRTGVNIDAIRYYERVGILPKARRAENGRRIYNTHDVQRLAFVRHARELDFGLREVRAFLTLQEHRDAPCELATKLAGAQLVAVERRIARLINLRRELVRIASSCGNRSVVECKVIEALRR